MPLLANIPVRIEKHLTTVGDGTSFAELTSDCTVATGTPANGLLKWTCPAGQIAWLNRIILSMGSDAGNTEIDGTGLGANSTLLTTGLVMGLADSAGAYFQHIGDTENQPWKENHMITRQCHDFEPRNAQGAGENFASWRWTFGRDSRYLTLLGGESILLTCLDNMTLHNLAHFACVIKGEYMPFDRVNFMPPRYVA